MGEGFPAPAQANELRKNFSGCVSVDDTAAINYTGRSTGMPKGCIHTQGDMVYTAATTVELSLGLKNDSHYLCVLPIFWMAGEVFGIVFFDFCRRNRVTMNPLGSVDSHGSD